MGSTGIFTKRMGAMAIVDIYAQIGAHITCASARQPLLTKSLMNELLVE